MKQLSIKIQKMQATYTTQYQEKKTQFFKKQ